MALKARIVNFKPDSLLAHVRPETQGQLCTRDVWTFCSRPVKSWEIPWLRFISTDKQKERLGNLQGLEYSRFCTISGPVCDIDHVNSCAQEIRFSSSRISSRWSDDTLMDLIFHWSSGFIRTCGVGASSSEWDLFKHKKWDVAFLLIANNGNVIQKFVLNLKDFKYSSQTFMT